jgi:hypothetical protein
VQADPEGFLLEADAREALGGFEPQGSQQIGRSSNVKLRIGSTALAAGLAMTVFLAGCAMKFKDEEKAIKNEQVNCATADGDMRVLQSEKSHVAQQIALGVTAIYPAGALIGLLTGTEGTKLKVATGEYNKMIDQKIAEIKATCGLE